MCIGIEIILPKHLHVATEWQPVEAIFRLAHCQRAGSRGELRIIDLRIFSVSQLTGTLPLDVFIDTAFIFLGAGSPAKTQALAPGENRMPESDGELIDPHIRPLGGEEMSQLVPENHETEPKHQQKDIASLIQPIGE